MADAGDVISDFQDNLLRQLHKHGFPDQAVAFPLESLFEAAARKGFSFNKVRDGLKLLGIETELEVTRVVFRKVAAGVAETDSSKGDGAEHVGLGAAAADVLASISPEQMKSLRDLVSKVTPGEMAAMRAQLDAMSDREKAEMMQKMKEMFGRS